MLYLTLKRSVVYMYSLIMALLQLDPSQIGINIAAFEFMKSIASPALDTFMQYAIESFWVVIPLSVLYLYLRKRMEAYVMAISYVLLLVIGEVLKQIFLVPRPCSIASLSWINHIACESSYSFPSNHATVLVGPLIFLRSSKVASALYVLWLITVLFGKVYLGQHYLTDIVAGAIVSILVVLILNRYSQKINDAVNRIVMRIIPQLAIKQTKQ